MAYDLPMAEKYRYYHVSRALIRNWSEDGKKASWCNPIREKSIAAGGIDRYFHSSYLDEDGKVTEYLEKFDRSFTRVVRELMEGNFSSMSAMGTLTGRELLLLQLYASPSVRGCFEDFTERVESIADSPLLKGLNATKERNEYYRKERWKELFDATNKAITFGVYLLDLTPCLLKAPEGKSFIIGASPLSIINTYVKRQKNIFTEGVRPVFMDRGTVIVLPLTPTLSFCLYDSDIYSLPVSDGVAALSGKDVDILNRVQIYNTGMNEGVLYTGDEKYVHSLVNRNNRGSSIRSGFPGDFSDLYPFSTLLSVMDMKKKPAPDDEELMRQFSINMKDYDDENFQKITGDRFWIEIENRNRYALRVLRYLRKQKE